MENKQQILVKRPVGLPSEDTWSFDSTPIRPLEEGEMLVEQHYISLDPAMRGWMNESRSYIPPWARSMICSMYHTHNQDTMTPFPRRLASNCVFLQT